MNTRHRVLSSESGTNRVFIDVEDGTWVIQKKHVESVHYVDSPPDGAAFRVTFNTVDGALTFHSGDRDIILGLYNNYLED